MLLFEVTELKMNKTCVDASLFLCQVLHPDLEIADSAFPPPRTAASNLKLLVSDRLPDLTTVMILKMPHFEGRRPPVL